MQPGGAVPLSGRIAFAAACAATVLAPVHALSRYATPDGREDLEDPVVRAWAEPAARALRALLDWSDPETVYTAYGRLWLPVLLAATVHALVVRRGRVPSGAERWGWRIALAGYVLATASVLGDYWTPWRDESFVVLGVPGMLTSVAGSAVLGVALLCRGVRPRSTGWLLATWPLTLVALSAVVALGAALLPMLWAWGLARGTGASLRPEPVSR
ncbi:hypothetical protein [Geodermatophilus nigrescens]|uniref:Integral membrane protein n=1 Tax=Geodermatophilus nigrescens TaxID=1070870 RepID=A0A1M5FV39_9ACTN|nr:hypothetical protein [Geodermatophilus nigrescens]SHF95410.1 hypothetical protein SAMN05444351_1415 [Geodermatophilus nigrescens]